MYSGFSKNNGSVVGDTSKGTGMEIEEAQHSTAAEESLICMNEEGEELILNARLDPDTGNLGWCQIYSQEEVMTRTVGMSQMTSMMRDCDRNSIYEKAIHILIENFSKKFEKAPIILDVGAGTGLLSLFAARKGAEFVIGVEMFNTMASIAERVVGSSEYSDKIMIVNAKSSDIDDLPVQPDLLISELLDSALLGEGCMPAHADAISRLLAQCCESSSSDSEMINSDFSSRVLPYSGEVHATLVQSVEIKHMHDTSSIAVPRTLHAQRTPPSMSGFPCKGGWSLVPVHWMEMLERGNSKTLSDKATLLHPNFTLTASDQHVEYTQPDTWQYTDIVAQEDGVVHGILLHWTLFLLSPELDPSRTCTYSTAPGVQNWQDHWQQIVYPLPEDISVQKSDIIRVYAMHDMVQIQLYASKISLECDHNSGEAQATTSSLEPDPKRLRSEEGYNHNQMILCAELPSELEDGCRNMCMCGWHVLCGAERFQAMCDVHRGEIWNSSLDALVSTLPAAGVVIDLSNGSLLGLSLAVKLRAVGKTGIKVVCKEEKQFSRLFFSQMADANDLENVFVWDGEDLAEIADFMTESSEEDINGNEDKEGGKEDMENRNSADGDDDDRVVDMTVLNSAVVAVISECYYYQLNALPVWQALAFYFQAQALMRKGLLHDKCQVLPGRAILRAVALQMPQLRNCHGLANTVCGFDHSELDAHQLNWYSHMYPYKIGSYQYTALGDAVRLGTIDFCSHSVTSSSTAAAVLSGETFSTELAILCSGSCDGMAVWVDYEMPDGKMQNTFDSATKQFAYHQTVNIKFFGSPAEVKCGDCVDCRIAFDTEKSDFQYDFEVKRV